ncbi:MAG: NAD-binding protein [Gaiellaceae bacterium]
MSEVPESAVVVGGGPVGVEPAQILSHVGARVPSSSSSSA